MNTQMTNTRICTYLHQKRT